MDRRTPLFCTSFSLIALLLTAPAVAQVEPADRDPLLPPNALVITAADLEAGVYGADLFDVLAAIGTQPGLAYKSSSDIGAEDWLLLRGLPRDSSRNVLVLVDDMPLNDGLSGAVELEHLPPIETIERIVILKAPLPARYGGYTGVVKVETRRSMEPGAELSLGAGEHGTRIGNVSVHGTKGRLSYLATVDWLETDNLTGERRSPPAEDQIYGDRSYESLQPFAKLQLETGERSALRLSVQHVSSDKAFSDREFRGEPEGRDRELTSINAGWSWRPVDGLDLDVSAFAASEDYGLNLIMHPSVRDQLREVTGARVDGTYTRHRHTLGFGGSTTDRSVRERQGSPLELESLRLSGLYLEDRIQLVEQLAFQIGARLDESSEGGSEINPSASLIYEAHRRFGLHATWGRSTRWPTLAEHSEELHQAPLIGESLEGFEIGANLEILPGRLRTQLILFRLDLEDEARFNLVFGRPGPPLAFYGNSRSTVRSEGIELATDARLGDRWRLQVNATFNEVTEEATGDPIAFAPPELLANAVLRYGAERLSGQVELRYGSTAEGVQQMMGGPTRLDDWLLLNLAASTEVVGSVELFARITNLTDETYETFDGRPMFGRNAIVGLTVGLR